MPWTARRSNQSILKEIHPGCSLEGLMLKLKLQYFGHLMWRVDSLEKTLMLGGTGGRRKRRRQRMRWLDGVRELVMDREAWRADREAWRAAIHGIAKSRTRLSDWTELNCKRKRAETQSNRAGRPVGGAPTPCKDCRAQQEEKTLSWQGLGQWKATDSVLLSQFSLAPYKSILLPLPGTNFHMVQTQNCDAQLILNNPMFAGQISGRLFQFNTVNQDKQ